MEHLQEIDLRVKLALGLLTGVVTLWALAKVLGRKLSKAWGEALGIKQVLLGRPEIVDRRTKRVISGEQEGIGSIVERISENLNCVTKSLSDMTVEVAGIRSDVEHVIGKVNTIEHEVQFNNGSSIKDATRRTEDAVARLEVVTAEVKQGLATVNTRLYDGDEKFAALEVVLQVQAEAQKTLWPALQAIAEARPPHEFDDYSG